MTEERRKRLQFTFDRNSSNPSRTERRENTQLRLNSGSIPKQAMKTTLSHNGPFPAWGLELDIPTTQSRSAIHPTATRGRNMSQGNIWPYREVRVFWGRLFQCLLCVLFPFGERRNILHSNETITLSISMLRILHHIQTESRPSITYVEEKEKWEDPWVDGPIK
jgi:hypothetical protein